MEGKLILRGVLAGALAGLFAFAFARVFAESQIQKAINYEDGRDAAQAALDKAAGLKVPAAASEVFSRTVQANIGIGVGHDRVRRGDGRPVRHRVRRMSRPGRHAAASVDRPARRGGRVPRACYLVPFLKYPANPPSIGHPDTIKQRGGLYLVMVLASVVFLVAAVWLGQRLRSRFGNWNASLLAGAAFVVAIGIVMLLLPSFGHLAANKADYGNHATETPLPLKDASGKIVYPGFPADVLFNFRLYSVGAQLILWSALGLVFAPMAERVLAPVTRPERAVDPVVA